MNAYDSEWADEQFPDDPNGNIYKGIWYFDGVQLTYPPDFRYLGEITSPHTTNPYREHYGPSGPIASSGGYSRQTQIRPTTIGPTWSNLQNVRYDPNARRSIPRPASARNVNIDEWLKYFAANTLIGNLETTLSTGVGDDYAMYRGELDTRFQLLVHDLDTVLGQGDRRLHTVDFMRRRPAIAVLRHSRP